jgi:hypothetical protein
VDAYQESDREAGGGEQVVQGEVVETKSNQRCICTGAC